MPPLRIVHLTPTANGAPWLVAFLIEQKKRGYDVHAVIAGSDGDIAPKLRAAGIPFDVLPFNLLGAGTPLKAGFLVLRAARLLRKLRPDIIQTHIFEATLLGRLAGWVADVPIVISMNTGPFSLESPLLRMLDIGTAFIDHKTVASCEYTRTLYLECGIPAGKLDVIYYTIDPAAFDPAVADGARVRRELGLSAATPVVGYVAFFYPKITSPAVAPPRLLNRGIKGHDVLIRAIPKVLEHFPDARFVLVGQTWGAEPKPCPDDLLALIRELGVEPAVVLAGKRDDVPDVLASFDVSVHCSLNDNLGGTAESLMMARPMVVSDIGGFRDTVLHEETGLRVPVDDPDALADGIVRLLRDRVYAKQLGEAGRRRMLERFTLQRSIDDLGNLYERCANERRGGNRFPRVAGYRIATSLVRLAQLPFLMVPLLFKAKALLAAAAAPPAVALFGMRLKNVALRLFRSRMRTPPAHPRIAIVIGTAENCQWAVDIARGLTAKGREVTAIIDSGAGSLGARFSEAGIGVRRVPMVFASSLDRFRLAAYLVRMPLSALRLASVLRRDRIDIVQSHIFPSVVIARAAAWLAGCRHIVISSSPRHLETPMTRIVEKQTWWVDDFTIAGCEYTRRMYEGFGLPPERCGVVYYGSDPARFNPAVAQPDRLRRELHIPADVPVVTLVANFYPPTLGVQAPVHTRGTGMKGHEHFLEAARIVLGKHPEARFLIVGSGVLPEGEAYRLRLVEQVRNDDRLCARVVFAGQRSDVPDVLAASDIAVQCSLVENLGGTIEALMMGVPMIATDVGGMPEAVRDGETGLIVPPADPAALAMAMNRLIENRPEAVALGRAGRELMLDRFTMTRTIEDIDAVLQRVTRQR